MAGVLVAEPVMSVPKWRFSFCGVTELGGEGVDTTVARTGAGDAGEAGGGGAGGEGEGGEGG